MLDFSMTFWATIIPRPRVLQSVDLATVRSVRIYRHSPRAFTHAAMRLLLQWTLHGKGPHAANFISVVLTVVLAGDEAVNAASRREEAMRRKANGDYIGSAKFNCDVKYDDSAVTAFSDVKVNEIAIGFYEPNAALYKKFCGR
jgi:hypothetical protein